MKQTYIDLMETALSAYSYEHIERYFESVKKDGLTEHGFARLVSNIGILIAHGRCSSLKKIFLEMMEFCCKTIPTVKAANDFSVREIISCICELEKADVPEALHCARWKGYLASIDPYTCYNVIARTPSDKVKNWALFTAVSEFFRQEAGLCNSQEFIDVQLASQLQWLDENGMYMDGREETHHPILYDLVPRGLFSLLLDHGYRGEHYQAIDACLKKSALHTLEMQSPNGEVAFGGRSNQFIHNEPWMMAIFEYEAKRYAREGNMALAMRFKSAIDRAMRVTKEWLSKRPIYHVKNRFPTESKFGCEEYAYFDKYMITVASKLHAAYQLCDDSVPTCLEEDRVPTVWATSKHFHKLFLKAEGYGLEFDLDADPHYDASGLGRLHRVGAPSAICLSTPCPAEPSYKVDVAQPYALSLCPAVLEGENWISAADAGAQYEILDTYQGSDHAAVTLCTRFDDGKQVTSRYRVDRNGVTIDVWGEGKTAFLLPVFHFDGEAYTRVEQEGQSVRVYYDGWCCCYEVFGDLISENRLFANRNGHYQTFIAAAPQCVRVKIEIVKA